MQLFDSHAHYDDDRFKEDAYEVIAHAYDSGVKYILNAGSDIKTSLKSLEFADSFDYVYAAVGVHPHEAVKLKDGDEDKIAELCMHSKAVAVGEIGLDYYYDYSPRDIQRMWFSRQIQLAKNLELPIVIHNRDAHDDTLRIVKEEAPFKNSGVFHCFSGSWDMAKELLKLGFYISIGGPVTFKNARKTVEVVKNVPLDMLLIETDCPYLTPEPFRGKRNDSSYVKFVAQKIAEIREVDIEEVARATTHNALSLFGITVGNVK